MPHASFKKKFRSFLDIREARDFCEYSGSDESIPYSSLSPFGASSDLEESTDVKSLSGDASPLRRAFRRTLSWKKRKSHSPTSTEALHFDEKLPPDDESCTIFIIGCSGVGKTAAVVRFFTGRYIHEYKSAQEESYTRNVDVDGSNISVNLTSMARKVKKDEDKFKQPCTGIMLAYSVVDLLSFYYVESLLDEINVQKTPTMIVGTKSDLENRRCICKATVEKLANDKGCCYSECSAATNIGVQDCFKQLILKSLEHGEDRWESSIMQRYDISRIRRRRSSVL